MNCKNLKHRKQNYKYYLYCTALKRIIQYEDCKNCKFKEYKTLQKSLQKDCRPMQSSAKIKLKSNKLAKLERDRFSILVEDLEHCAICGNKKEHLHEVYCGKNRQNSMAYGLVLPICSVCHTKYQNDANFNLKWHKKGQILFIKNYPGLDFIDIFHKNYL